tara:strand:- start:1795 stop:2406 length:612 start_codon:yes stop_codon:yes gene_type:complete
MAATKGGDRITKSKSSSGLDPFQLVSQIKQRGPAPVHLWDPPYCGEMDMLIARDGSWIHEGRPIKRQAMVKLFASILRLDEDQHYYLVTPVEKVRIRVEDCPFVAIAMEVDGSGEEQIIRFTTNTGDSVIVDAAHPIQIETEPGGETPHPMVPVRHGLNALINRAVFYRLVDLGVERSTDNGEVLGVWSSHCFFELGSQHSST